MGTQRYSPEFKQQVVEELLAGAKRPGQICRERGIDFSALRKCREQYAQQGGSQRGALRPSRRRRRPRTRSPMRRNKCLRHPSQPS
jgi:transposase-like protein